MARNNREIEIDDTALIAAFKRLSSKELTKITKVGLTSAARIIQKDVKRNIASNIKNKGVKYNDMIQAALISKGKKGDYNKVHIFGSRKYYFSYVTRFMAIGTNKRYNNNRNGRRLNKKRYTGIINKVNLFANVNERKAYLVAEKYITKRLSKLYKIR